MIFKILCLLGCHQWHCSHKWEPDINAEIVTKYTFIARCSRCGKIEGHIDEFDPQTGQPL